MNSPQSDIVNAAFGLCFKYIVFILSADVDYI